MSTKRRIMSKKPELLREVEWGIRGGDCDKTCIYALGRMEWEEFLARLKEFHTDVPAEAIDEVAEIDIEYVRFRSMSPYEAQAWGCTSGVIETDEDKGYPVTRVIL